MDIWETDLSFAEAFRRSCVPCYQEIARKIGVGRMKEKLQQLVLCQVKNDGYAVADFFADHGPGKPGS
ncbi:MAG: hypothetical protein D6722_29235, partial [Bacteroidetes bacterium]